MSDYELWTPVYLILMHNNPQALADLDSLQRKRYGVSLSRISEIPVGFVKYDYQGEDLEDIAREMAQAPSRSRG